MRGMFVATLFALVTVAAVSSTYVAIHMATVGKPDLYGIANSQESADLPAVVMRARVR